MVMRLGLWNVRSLYRVGSLTTVSRELARYKLDLVGVQEVRWEGGGTEPAGEYTFFYGNKRNAYRLLVRKPHEKRPLGRPRCRFVDNIKMDLGEVGWGDVDWIGLAQDRNRWRVPVNSVLNLRVP
jgi:hypothetical protein